MSKTRQPDDTPRDGIKRIRAPWRRPTMSVRAADEAKIGNLSNIDSANTFS